MHKKYKNELINEINSVSSERSQDVWRQINYEKKVRSKKKLSYPRKPSLKFIRLLRVVFSSEQRLNRPEVNAVQ